MRQETRQRIWTQKPRWKKTRDLTLKMESLLIHSNGERAVVLIIDSYHSSLWTQAKPFRLRDTSCARSLRSSGPLPHTRKEREWTAEERMGGVREEKMEREEGDVNWERGERAVQCSSLYVLQDQWIKIKINSFNSYHTRFCYKKRRNTG